MITLRWRRCGWLLALLFGLAALLPAWAQVTEAQKAGVVKIVSRGKATRTGAGFVLRRDGDSATIITAAHVVEDADTISIQFYPDGRSLPGRARHIEANNPQGLALIIVSGALPAALAALPLNPDAQLSGGELLYTIGHQASGGDWSVLSGSFANRVGRTLRIQVPVREQASGGPVIFNGSVIGLVMQSDPVLGFGLATTAAELRNYAQGVPGALNAVPAAGAAAASAVVVRPPPAAAGPAPSPSAAVPGAASASGAQQPVLASAAALPASSAGPVIQRDCAECPELVVLPAGRYTMGSASGDAQAWPNERPAHEVRIGAALMVGRSEVSRQEFGRFVQATGHVTDAERGGCTAWNGRVWQATPGRHWREPGFVQTPSHPVVCVSWNDAQAYLRWLAQTTGKRYRLPSEAEWEYAARSAQPGAAPAACQQANGADVRTRLDVVGAANWPIAPCSDGFAYTAPAEALLPDALGLRHLRGNVAEWVQDGWHEHYERAPVDGAEWTAGADTTRRVVRGGGWNDPPRDLRPASRDWQAPEASSTATGFRVVRAP